MIRKDFIQRHFDELAKVLAAVLQLKNDLKPVEAEAKISDFANDFLGISLDEVLALDNSPLTKGARGINTIEYLQKNKAFTLDHFKILEDLLYHKYLLDKSNHTLKNLTLEVLNYVAIMDTNYSLERMNRIKELS